MTKNNDLPPLDSLDERIAKAREQANPIRTKPVPEAGKSVALRSGTELIAGVAVGGFLGYHADEWLGTRPACTVFGIFLGMAGGVMNIYHAVSADSASQADNALSPSKSERDTD
jgi:ATP synthase protein I